MRKEVWIFFALNLIFFQHIANQQLFVEYFFWPWILFLLLFELNKKELFISVVIPVSLILFNFLIGHKNGKITDLFNWIIPLQRVAVEHINSIYSIENARLINLFLFNFAKKQNPIYEQAQHLGIVHLLIISGFHLAFIKKIIIVFTKKFTKNNQIQQRFSFIVLFIFWWLINFSVTGNKSVFCCCMKEKNSFIQWSKIVFFTFLICPNHLISYSFLLSFGIMFCFHLLNELNLSQFLLNLYQQITAFVFSNLLLSAFVKKIYFLGLINLLIFFPIFFLFFIYLIFISWFSFMKNATEVFCNFFRWLLENMKINKSYIAVDWMTQEISAITISFAIFFLLLFIFFQKDKK